MAKRNEGSKGRSGAVEESPEASSSKCLAIASRGVKTGSQFAALMSATISDLITGAITPQVGNAICNAGGKLLKVVEMQQKWGAPSMNGEVKKDLQLVE